MEKFVSCSASSLLITEGAWSFASCPPLLRPPFPNPTFYLAARSRLPPLETRRHGSSSQSSGAGAETCRQGLPPDYRPVVQGMVRPLNPYLRPSLLFDYEFHGFLAFRVGAGVFQLAWRRAIVRCHG